jgi:FkbM family methyltransferase
MRTGLFPIARRMSEKFPRMGGYGLKLASRMFPTETPHWGIREIADSIDYRLLVPARLANGMRMQVVWTDGVGSAIRSNGCYEPEVVSVFLSHLKPDDTVVDIGAHVGQYTLFAAGIGCTVHSFEPEPRTFSTLSANVTQNQLNSVFLNQCAVTETSGSADLFLANAENIGATSLLPNEDSTSKSSSVRCVALDEYMREQGEPPVALIKIDVEGGELNALRGARWILHRDHPKLILEFFGSRQAAFGYSCSDIASFLQTFGYRLWKITPTGLIPYVREHDEERYFNVFAE